jgi:MFS family permease
MDATLPPELKIGAAEAEHAFRKPVGKTRKNLRYCTADGVCAMPWLALSLPGSYITAGLLNSFFNIGPFWFGVVAAMPPLANGCHIFLMPFFARFMKIRDMVLSFGWLNLGAWIGGLVGIAFLPVTEPDKAGLFFAILYSIISLSSSLMTIAWTAWAGDFVPERLRGRYFGKRNLYGKISAVLFMLLSIAVLAFMDASRQAYLALILLAIIGRMISLMTIHLIESPDPTGGSISQEGWGNEIRALRRHSDLIRFMLFGSLTGFWLAAAGTIGALYAFNELGVTPARFTTFFLTSSMAGAVCLTYWGRFIDRHGAIPVILITLTLWRLSDIGWIVITPDTLHWMYAVWLSGGAMGLGFALAMFTLLLKLTPANSRSAGISLNLTCTSLAAALAPFTVGVLVPGALNVGLTHADAYRMGMAACIVGALCSLLILPRAKKRTGIFKPGGTG